MSNRRLIWAAAALLGFGGNADPALAQRSPALPGGELASAYRRQRDSLSAWVARTDRRTTLDVDSARKAHSFPVSRGSITVQTAPAYADIVAVGLHRVDSLLARSPLGGAIRQPITLRLHPHWERLRQPPGGSRMWILDRVLPDGSEAAGDWWQSNGEAPSVDDIARALVVYERNRRIDLLPTALTTWLGGGPLNTDLEDRWTRVYTRLASSPTTIATACLVGNLGACRQVLRLESTRDPLIDWFTPSARRTLVLPYARGDEEVRRALERALPGALSSCVDGADDIACQRILRDYMGVDGWGDPLRSADGREALVQAAVRMPGAPGLSAIMGRADLGTIASLEAMSGSTLDLVLQAWIAEVRAAEPDRVQLPAHRVLSAVFWVFAFGALALGGSRWRSQ